MVQRRYRAIALGHGVVSFFTHTELDGGFRGRFAAGLVASDADMVTDHLERSFGLLQEAMKEKVEAFGWECREVDGHDVNALQEALSSLPFAGGKPSAVICHTVKSKGIPFAENDPTWHHKSRIPPEQIAKIYQALGDI